MRGDPLRRIYRAAERRNVNWKETHADLSYGCALREVRGGLIFKSPVCILLPLDPKAKAGRSWKEYMEMKESNGGMRGQRCAARGCSSRRLCHATQGRHGRCPSPGIESRYHHRGGGPPLHVSLGPPWQSRGVPPSECGMVTPPPQGALMRGCRPARHLAPRPTHRAGRSSPAGTSRPPPPHLPHAA